MLRIAQSALHFTVSKSDNRRSKTMQNIRDHVRLLRSNIRPNTIFLFRSLGRIGVSCSFFWYQTWISIF